MLNFNKNDKSLALLIEKGVLEVHYIGLSSKVSEFGCTYYHRNA